MTAEGREGALYHSVIYNAKWTHMHPHACPANTTIIMDNPQAYRIYSAIGNRGRITEPRFIFTVASTNIPSSTVMLSLKQQQPAKEPCCPWPGIRVGGPLIPACTFISLCCSNYYITLKQWWNPTPFVCTDSPALCTLCWQCVQHVHVPTK